MKFDTCENKLLLELEEEERTICTIEELSKNFEIHVESTGPFISIVIDCITLNIVPFKFGVNQYDRGKKPLIVMSYQFSSREKFFDYIRSRLDKGLVAIYIKGEYISNGFIKTKLNRIRMIEFFRSL